MKKGLIGVLLLFFHFAFSQDLKKTIDSIQHTMWEKQSPNLDSLDNPTISHVETAKKNIVIIPRDTFSPSVSGNVPITPFVINKNTIPKWYFFGQNNLIINQASFSNWNSGGNNNIGANARINYNLTYKNRNHYLENILQLGYGWIANSGQSNRKTEDNINYMVNYGYDLGRNYYFSTGFSFLTQFAPGYNYKTTPNPTYADRISGFMAPGYLTTGIGISYNPTENFQAIFRPTNAKLTFIMDAELRKKGKYGLEYDGQKLRTEFGAFFNIIYRLKIYKGMTLDHNLGFFSNYLYHPERVDISYDSVLNIQFNKYISTVLSFFLIYDHDQIQKLQTKQTLGIGINYNFGAQNSVKQGNKKLIKPFIIN